MTFDALPDHSRQCEYTFARIIRASANNSRQCETALTVCLYHIVGLAEI